MTNEAWREVVEVDGEQGITRIKRTSAYDTFGQKFVTILGVDPDTDGGDYAVIVRDGSHTENDPNRPLRSVHFSWLRKDKP